MPESIASRGRVTSSCSAGTRRVDVLGPWSLWIALAAFGLGCQFDGYVPKGKHQPVAEEERDIAPLAFDEPITGSLDCEAGRCRVRYQMQIAADDRIEIDVDGPRADIDSRDARLARVMLQDVNGRVVARNDVEARTGPMRFAADVTPGPYFVLIQGLGPEFQYQITARRLSGSAAPAPSSPAGAAATATAAAGAGTPAATPPRARRPAGAGAHKPGDTGDGADFAYDPRFDLINMRSFAFTQNPQAELDGAAAEEHGNPFVIRRIQREISYLLADRGVDQVEAASADFLVSVQVGSSTTTWYSLDNVPHTTSYDAYYDRWRGVGAFVNAHVAVNGTLIIDFVDPKSGELVWHGWTTEPVNVNLDGEKQLKGAVKAVLSQYAEN